MNKTFEYDLGGAFCKSGYFVEPIRRRHSESMKAEGCRPKGRAPKSETDRLLHEKGRETEERFARVVADLIASDRCPWLISIRKSTPREDHHGHYDFVLTLSQSTTSRKPYEIAVDVKTSYIGAEAHRSKHEELKGIFLIIAGVEHVKDSGIRRQIYRAWINSKNDPSRFSSSLLR